MNPVIKAMWLNDLRSGAIPQTQDILADGEARCCLGVLSDIAVRNGAAQSRVDENNVVHYFTKPRTDWYNSDHDETDTSLPIGIAAWCDLPQDESGPSIPADVVRDDDRIRPASINYVNEESVVYLSTLNDKDFTFTEIADLIEEHL